MATAQSPICWLVRIIQFFSTAHHPIICLLQSTNYFTTWNRLNISLLCIEKLYDTFKSPIWKYFDDLYGYCSKPNFFATGHLTFILLLRISQLFVYFKSTNYFTTGNRLNISLLFTEKFYDNFKSPIWKQLDDLNGSCAKPNFLATAHHIFICYFASPNYLCTVNRPIISPLDIVNLVSEHRKIL